MRYCIGFLFYASLIVILFCGGEKTYTEKIRDEVRYVKNISPKWGDGEKLSLEHVRTFGGMEIEDEDRMLAHPINVCTDIKNNVYIVDYRGNNIKKYDAEGKFIKNIGKEGQGPGEMSRPMQIAANNRNEILISEGSGRIHVFSLDGDFSRTITPGARPAKFLVTKNNLLLLYSYTFFNVSFDEMDKKPFILGEMDEDGNILKKFCAPLKYEDSRKTFIANYIDFDVDREGNIYIAFSKQNRIERYSPEGRQIFQCTRPLNFETEYKEEIEVWDMGGKKVDVPQHKFSMVSRGVGVDNSGRIWVLTYTKQPVEGDRSATFHEFDVFDGDGVFLTKVSMPDHAIDNVQQYGDRMFFVDPHETAAVYEYRIMEK